MLVRNYLNPHAGARVVIKLLPHPTKSTTIICHKRWCQSPAFSGRVPSETPDMEGFMFNKNFTYLKFSEVTVREHGGPGAPKGTGTGIHVH